MCGILYKPLRGKSYGEHTKVLLDFVTELSNQDLQPKHLPEIMTIVWHLYQDAVMAQTVPSKMQIIATAEDLYELARGADVMLSFPHDEKMDVFYYQAAMWLKEVFDDLDVLRVQRASSDSNQRVLSFIFSWIELCHRQRASAGN